MKVYVVERLHYEGEPEEYWDIYKVTKDEEEAGVFAGYGNYEVTEWEI